MNNEIQKLKQSIQNIKKVMTKEPVKPTPKETAASVKKT